MASRRWRWMRRLVLYPLLTLLLAVAGGAAYYVATIYPAGPPQEGWLALTGATVLTGPELEPVPGATVLVRDGVITEVGTGVAVPPGAQVIELAGHTVVPGLIDSHVHFGSPERARGEDLGALAMPGLVADWVRYFPDKRRDFLAHGVTSVRSMGDEYPWITEVRRAVEQGEIEGPRLFVAGPLFTTRGGHPVATLGLDPDSGGVRIPQTPAQARTMVRDLATGAEPVDLIKVVQERGSPERGVLLDPIDLPVLRAIVTEAHTRGLRVFAHWGSADDLRDVLAAGVDGLDHLESRGAGAGWPAAAVQTIVERDLTLAPTLAVTEVAVPADVHRTLRERADEFYRGGGRTVAGSDAGMPGVFAGAGLIRELELLVEAGLTPRDALIAATSTAATAMRAGHVGAVAPGRAADLLVVRGDPLADIAAVRAVQLVLRDGRIVVDNR